jgi:class 3 adenylate cyclase
VKLRVYVRLLRRNLRRNGKSISAGALAGVAVAILIRAIVTESGTLVMLGVALGLLVCYLLLRKQERLRPYLDRAGPAIEKFKKRLHLLVKRNSSAIPNGPSEPGAPSRELGLGPDLTPEVGLLDADAPRKREYQVLHGSIRQFNSIVESTQDPMELTNQLNHYFSTVQARINARGGKFERYAGSSFIAYWEDPTHALLGGLELRKDFQSLNESFRVDGHKSFMFGMGFSSGMVLTARIGPAGEAKLSILGEVVACARALDQLSAVVGQDILVSGELWKKVQTRFFGELLGEAKLTNDTGLMEYHSLGGYWDSQGRPVQVTSPYSNASIPQPETTRVQVIVPARRASRWLINNGSQIIGPFAPEEIAARLFAQELDFDCECWQEGTGSSAQLRNSGIFGSAPSNDPLANCWVFDGETIHGPVSPGFLRTSLQRGLLPSESYLCQESTIHGWKRITESLIAQLPPTPLQPISSKAA